MPNRNATLAAAVLGAAVCFTGPALAQSFVEPAVAAQPIEVAVWQGQVERDLPGIQRFEGLPQMRFGLVVTSTGTVRSCMALPLDGESGARGQPLCPSLIQYARFTPARDAEGRAIDSVFIADFGSSRPVVAARYAGVPIL